MFSRPILLKQEKLVIVVDSRSLNGLLADRNNAARIILQYSTSKSFEFVRSPVDTEYAELKNVPPFILQYDDAGNLTSIDIVRNQLKSMTRFGYRIQDIERIGKLIYKKPSLSLEEWEAILLVFIHAALNIRDDVRIMTTSNEVLLNNRTWFECHFPGGPLNIATVEETKEIMDLFAKSQNKYFTSGNSLMNKGLWYLCSFRSKVPNYHRKDDILAAFASRFVYLLMSIDEIGFQYYSDTNNDTMENMIYHFNYFIALVSGILDALAIRAKKQLDIKLDRDAIDSRTSLNPKAGKEFLKATRDKNPDLRKHITNYIDFIKLIYAMRNLILHREMLPKSTLDMATEKWKANFMSVDTNIVDLIRLCGDKSQNYEPMTSWGLYKLLGEWLLEPYHFSKAAANKLAPFCNTFLQLLGFTDFIETRGKQEKADHFIRILRTFRGDNLGF